MSDYLHGYARPFPDDIATMIDELTAIDPTAFEHRGPHGPLEWTAYTAEHGDWLRWGRGEDLDEARSFLQRKIDAARKRS